MKRSKLQASEASSPLSNNVPSLPCRARYFTRMPGKRPERIEQINPRMLLFVGMTCGEPMPSLMPNSSARRQVRDQHRQLADHSSGL